MLEFLNEQQKCDKRFEEQFEQQKCDNRWFKKKNWIIKTKKKHSFTQDLVLNSVGQFKYDLEEITFEAYFCHYKEVFQKDCEKWSDKKKMYFLLGKFGPSEHEK